MDLETMNRLLQVGVQNGASDIHFKVGDPPTYRVNGSLRNLKGNPLTPSQSLEICKNLISDKDVKGKLDGVQEYDTSYSLEGVARFRVNVYRQRGSLSAILRIIPPNVPTAEQLGLPKQILRFAEEERGLVLVTGATGSGKSSTLAAIIDAINRSRRVHILTIEDPIEFLHRNQKASVSQREIGLDTANFNKALRAALRQDPDVILVGEMRDNETIDIALKAAETGHMVFSTVHTTDAAKTIGRLVSTFPADEQRGVRLRLADNLKGTVSQRLLPRVDGKGRAVACEIMFTTKSIQECIKDADRTPEVKGFIEKSRDTYQMQSFDQHLTELYRQGDISLEVAKAAASNPSDFERALHFE